MSATVLVLNAGSSSLKFETFGLAGGRLASTMRGQVDGLGASPRLVVRAADGASLADEPLPAALDSPGALDRLLDWLGPRLGPDAPAAVGHRVVHGGTAHAAPVRVDDALLESLERLVPLAPLHQPHNLAPIRALAAARPGLPQVACFDTAFHRTQPDEAELYALPAAIRDAGVRRYGFHGLSYESIARQLPDVSPRAAAGRTIVAHLGSGVSLCAMLAGRSVATTMGFTALDGCPMGTRCGQLDPGVVLWLARERGLSIEAIERLLYRESGLLGLSGVSSDMRALLASDAPGARLAIDHFTYRVAREVGSLAAALGGLDALVFTAGIGERSVPIRAAIAARCAWLGLDLDERANEAGGPRLDRPGSRVEAWRLPTHEELAIAERTVAVLGLR
ncbi:MAG TPA: acetate/propionate family kinase [Burkholderiaceae bacterium]|nr:acetate/propionate family kinase [Burkholderiaceae bacterium]